MRNFVLIICDCVDNKIVVDLIVNYSKTEEKNNDFRES